jgi:S-adenosyl methyltransferase
MSEGVRQFLDLGSGLPNMANTHQVAHRAAPEARVM